MDQERNPYKLLENSRSYSHEKLMKFLKDKPARKTGIYSKTRSLDALIIDLVIILLIYNYIPRTYLLHTSSYSQSMLIQNNVIQQVATKCRKRVMTLISYIYNRYTIRKTSDMYSKQKKKKDFQDPEAQFYSKTRQIVRFITYLAY